jgi:hypothetical protein
LGFIVSLLVGVQSIAVLMHFGSWMRLRCLADRDDERQVMVADVIFSLLR